ncbi:LOW QUALITY PROTEIN: putative disease resistance protein RGA3 [Pistacia vera]|uniref:LOW QUALITY PROTEIN: putative disease resistance protein RGA3 n=1 Tax=Pistacia vera TaxID=55513 RepID=UPI001262D7E7|nr:LOW QUALITY PROTEIN: putative disease resistance protein RGA3 [Pistacia vera]
MAADKSKFQLTERVSVDSRYVFPRERVMTHSFVHSSNVIGRDSDKENIINFLLELCDLGNVPLVPIVGIGGLGKTTLARMVYNDEKVNRHFSLKMWVCVSEDFNVTRLMKEIIDSATGEYCTKLTADQLQARLRKTLGKTLGGKKFLLILDDVWNEDRVKWIELRELLMGGANGSKIIVTTRSNQVASIIGTVPPYVLRGLPHEDCLFLFLKWAFVDGEEKRYSNLVKIGDGIVRKCGGVPLAVRTLGSLLYAKTDENDWLFIKDNDIWRLEQGENGILPVLKLSYDYLPSYLQCCFAYCSLFPKDYCFDSRYLVYYWMALGLLFIPNDNELLEDVRLRYLKELLSRCFFQDVEDYGFYFTFKMHDLLHDLSVLVARRECLTVNFKTQNVDIRVRHFSLIDNPFNNQEDPNLLNNARSVRTFFLLRENDFFTESFLSRCLSRFKYFRLLSLSSILRDVLPDSVGTLKHLRYLDLSHNFFFGRTPRIYLSASQFANLKTCWFFNAV